MAQTATTGAIAGTVRDTTGAVLPGVTVEAASPALIEKVRIAVTDQQGNYRIVDLRPGTYRATFTLPGFATYRREGIELTTGFTAPANAEMKIGSIEETVTVTGASPVVDVRGSGQQRVLSRELLDNVPTGKALQGFAALTLGASLSAGQQDVGGDRGDSLGGFGYHGTRASDQRLTREGMPFTTLGGDANQRNTMINQAFTQEMTLDTRGASAENEAGGPHVNVVPKDGGNNFSWTFTGNGTNGSVQADNVSAELQARGLPPQSSVRKIWDLGGGVGGPIRRDKIWFYTAHRWWGAQSYLPGSYYNKLHGQYIGTPNSGVARYEPDLDRQAYLNVHNEDHSGRLTWQATARNKFNFSSSFQSNCNCNLGTAGSAPESFRSPTYFPISLNQVSWSLPATNRLLFEGGATFLYNNLAVRADPVVTRSDIAIVEQSTSLQYNARAGGLFLNDYGEHNLSNQFNSRFAVSYVTGSHAFKTGFTLVEGWQNFNATLNDPPLRYQFRNGLPVSLTQWASPFEARSRFHPNLGLFAQDQWTIRRLTLDAGVRFDYLHGINRAWEIPAGAYVPARTFSEVQEAPKWTDLAPRLGAAYDLFGNGKTAIKATWGRYVELASIFRLTYAMNPASTMATSSTRTWNDTNGNFVPDCNLLTPLANAECGAGSDASLGQLRVVQSYDTEVTKGFGNRPYNWQTGFALQHELRPNMALTAGYYRTSYGNFSVTDNRAVTPADFDPYCITTPTDARLGAASGKQLCGFYNVRLARFGQVDNYTTQTSNFGKRTEVYNGFDIGINARLGRGGLVQGGMSSGRTDFNSCVVVDSPEAAQPGFCNSQLPFRGQTQVKFAVVYPLPFHVQVSGTYQNLPGIPLSASVVVPNAQIAPSLGRNLSAGATANVTLSIMEPNTLFEDRRSQVDLRFARIFRTGQVRWTGMFDVYNVFNANSVLGQISTFGAAWRTPTSIVGGRLAKFGVQVDF